MCLTLRILSAACRLLTRMLPHAFPHNPHPTFPALPWLRRTAVTPHPARQRPRWLVNPLRLLGGRKESESKGGKDGPKQGSFGEDNQFYYDEAKKRWVMKGQVRCGVVWGGVGWVASRVWSLGGRVRWAAASSRFSSVHGDAVRYVCALDQRARSLLVLHTVDIE